MNQWKSINEQLTLIVNEMKSQAPHKSGALANSISSELFKTDSGFKVFISMLPYGVFQDEGVNGTEVSRGSRFSFSEKRPPSYAFQGKFSYAIATSIYKKGFKAQPFIDPAMRKLDNLADGITEELWQNFEEGINDI